MLEPCTNLAECERILSAWVERISLLGQIPLSEADVQELNDLIASKMAADPIGGSDFLWARAPTCLCCLLVWIGIREYRGGEYWPEVHRRTRLPPVWQGVWGEFFLDYLQSKGLPTFADVGGHRYVTPILAHGGIPDYCLPDFFQNVLLPVISGRLPVDGSNMQEVLQEWQARPLFTEFTDKPVRRFLLYGGKVAADFLSRCLEMAQRAYQENVIPTADELGLPLRVVGKFTEWWQSHQEQGQAPPRPRFRRPVLLLAPEDGEVQLYVPPQKLRDVPATTVRIEIYDDRDNRLREQPLRAYRSNRNERLIETEEVQLPIDAPAKSYNIRLLADGPVASWHFPGLVTEPPVDAEEFSWRPWMAFDGRTRKLLPGGELPRARVWLLFPNQWSLGSSDVPVMEGPYSFYGNWVDYEARLIDLSSARELSLRHREHRPKRISLASDPLPEPALIGDAIPFVKCESDPVYGYAPSLRFTASGPIGQWRVSIVPQDPTTLGERKDIPLREFLSGSSLGEAIQIPLSDDRLLGERAAGRFLLRLQGPLRKDCVFRFALLPGLTIKFDEDLYTPNTHEAHMTLTAQSAEDLDLEGPCQLLEEGEQRWEVKVPGTESYVRCTVSIRFNEEAQVEMPLVIQVPRLRLAIRGLGENATWQWSHTVHEISMREWEDSDEILLLVEIPTIGEGHAAITLAGTDQHDLRPIKRGKVQFSLKRFSDTLRDLRRALTCFLLSVEGTPLQVIPGRI